MENGKIKAFKLTSKGVSVKFTDNPIEQGELTHKVNNLVVERGVSHKLSNQLRSLLAHALIIGGLASTDDLTEKVMKSRKIIDMPKFKKFSLVGLSLSKDGEDEEISFELTMIPEISSRYEIKLKPFPLKNEKYIYSSLLMEDKNFVLEEIEAYIKGENYYEQGNLFNQEEEVEEKDVEF